MANLTVCLNCLTTGATGCPVGPEQGTQYDPYRYSIPLCDECKSMLIAGDIKALRERYRAEATISRKPAYPNPEDRRKPEPTLVSSAKALSGTTRKCPDAVNCLQHNQHMWVGMDLWCPGYYEDYNV